MKTPSCNLAVILTLLGLVATGCTFGSGASLPATRIIPSPPQDIAAVAWLTGDTIVATFGSADAGPDRLEQVDIRSGSVTQISTKTDTRCSREDLLAPVRLPDGRIAFLDRCITSATGPDATTIVAVDVSSGSSRVLADLGGVVSDGGPFALDPSLTRVVVAVGNQLCNSIAFYRDSALATPDVEIRDGSSSFRLNAVSDGHQDCTSDPIVDWPDWSPDGSTVAFVASTAASGATGPGRLDNSFTIWALDAASWKSHMVLSGMTRPRSLRWSPDGKTLALSADFGGESGTWLVDVATGAPHLVSRVSLDWLAWSPDSGRLVGSKWVGGHISDLMVVPVP